MNKPVQIKQPYTVSALTRELQQHLESHYDWVQVQGEITNFKKAPSGHVYFSLKDEDALLQCVAWRSTAVRWSGLDLKNGTDVIAGGNLTIYPPRGQYQLVVTALRLAGLGALQQRFDELKARLAAEGLFDAARKKPLPAFPQTVAVITSSTGAAIRDFLRIIHQTECPIHVRVCPVLVQGVQASNEIAGMLDWVNQHCPDVDAIVLCRGGGSLEDLWAFNEENVARAISRSAKPVISAIGHEVDFTIADFTADYRAPTPTAAAQVFGDLFLEHRSRLAYQNDRLMRIVRERIERERERFEVTRKAVRRYHPQTAIGMFRQRLDDIHNLLTNAANHQMNGTQSRIRLNRDRLFRIAKHAMDTKKQTIAEKTQILKRLDAQSILARGFAVCRDRKGMTIRDAKQVDIGGVLSIRLAKGSIESSVTKVSG